MTAQHLPLRLLTSFEFFSNSRFALKALTFAPSSLRFSTVRCLSSLPARSRDSRDDARSSFRSARAISGGKGKGLIDDEAELSDWVSDLNTSSIRLGMGGSDDDDDDSISRVRVRDRDSGGFSDRRNMRGNLSNRGSRGGPNGLRGGRDSGGFSDRRDSGGFSERRSSRGSLPNRGSRGGSNGLRNGRGSDKKMMFGSDSEDEDEEEGNEFLSQQRGGRGGSFGGSGGKAGVESSYKQGRKAHLHEISEEEEEDEEGEDSGFDDGLFGDDEVDEKKVGMKDSVLKSVGKYAVRSVGGGEDSYLSNTRQVTQMHLVAPLEKQFSILYGILKDHVAEDVDYKVIVFCTTAMVTRLVADLLTGLRLNVREIHSRKPQSYRTRVSKEFKESKGIILVSSDVSARGVDYPDVTLVVQIGVPADREQYIHRLGRTGRKGKEGEGILVLAPWEEFFLSSIKDLPITQAPMPLIDPDTRKKVEHALNHAEMKNKEAAYQAWLGYYNSNKSIGRDKCKLVLLANEFSRSMGLDYPPAIAKLVLRKMGLSSVPGLRTK